MDNGSEKHCPSLMCVSRPVEIMLTDKMFHDLANFGVFGVA